MSHFLAVACPNKRERVGASSEAIERAGGKKPNHLLQRFLGCAAALVLALGCPLALALDLQTQATFNIAPQKLATALVEFSRQANAPVVSATQEVDTFDTQGVSGTLSLKDALEALLNGTNLETKVTESGAIAIGKFGRTADAERLGMRLAQNAGTSGSPDTGTGVDPSLSQAPSGEQNNNGENPQEGPPEDSPEGAVLEEVIVTGSVIRGARPVGTDLITIDRDTIEYSGHATAQELVRTLPQNFAGSQNEATAIVGSATTNTNFGSSVNLRGLGADATLTLINGRRLAPAGLGSFVDISSIPLAAVERIEVVPDGASATYGADAVGGVVNFIMRPNYEGAQTQLRYGDVTTGESPEIQLSQLVGTEWGGGNVLLSYEYYERDALSADERRFSANSDLTSLGGDNFSSLQSNPGNIFRVGTTNVQFAVPAGQDGTSLSQAELLVGQSNFQNIRENTDLLPKQERHAAFISASQLVGKVNLFAEGLYSHRDFSVRDNRAGSTLLIPATNAYRVMNGLFPGGGVVRMNYNMTDDLGPQVIYGEVEAIAGTFGARMDLAASWQTNLSLSYADLGEDSRTPSRVDTAALNAALAQGDPATAFNPFADGSNTNANILASVIGSSYSKTHTAIRS